MPKKETVVLERRFFPAGHSIIKQGDAGTVAYLVQSGKVEVFNETEDRRMTLATLGPGEFFGEMALIAEEPRAASVDAKTDTQLIIVTRGALHDKLERSDKTIQALVKMMIKRLTSTNDALLNENPTTQDLLRGARLIFERMMSTSLAPKHKSLFRKTVVPSFEDFEKKVKEFEKETQKK